MARQLWLILLGAAILSGTGHWLFRKSDGAISPSCPEPGAHIEISKPGKFPGGFHRRGIALELARNVEDVSVILGCESNRNSTVVRDELRGDLRVDYLFIIPFYWAVLAMGAAFLRRQDAKGGLLLSLAAGVCATGAALFDMLLENTRINTLLNTPWTETTNAMAEGIRQASLCKWTLLFMTVAILASLFTWRKERTRFIGYFYWLTAVIGFIGLYWHPALELGFGLLVIDLLVLLVVLLFCRKHLLRVSAADR